MSHFDDRPDPRTLVDSLIAADHVAEARNALIEIWSRSPSLPNAVFTTSRFERLRDRLGLAPLRVAILRSFTVEPILPVLRASAFVAGIDLDVHVGEFNAYSQEILDPGSSLYRFQPSAVILAVQSRDLSPTLWSGFADLNPEGISTACDEAVSSLSQLVMSLRSRSDAAILLHSLELPATPALGIHDNQCNFGQADAFDSVNRRLRNELRSISGAYVVDYAGLVARRGAERWFDSRKWLTARLPVQVGEFGTLAAEWIRYLQPLSGRLAKVLAVDLDNTLWGGVIGEEGVDGIRLGLDHPGAHYTGLQRVLLDLRQRGILLAICSKNNIGDVREAFERHPAMLLKLEHFATIRANWDDKASNIRSIAAELNVGIDAVAFLDDNPVERRWVRSQLPEVAVLEMPEDPCQVPDAVARWPVFERLRLTDEDRTRSRLYAEDRARTELRSSSSSLEDFLRSLRIRVHVASVTPATITRVAQLTQKTNQFNLTTRRCSEQQIEEFARQEGGLVLTLSAWDRFGDNGLVGVAMVRVTERGAELHNLLMSCRVIGRTIETAFLACLARLAKSRGASELAGCFIPTKKNAPARDFFKDHGFRRAGGSDEEERWVLDLEHEPGSPAWVDVRLDPAITP